MNKIKALEDIYNENHVLLATYVEREKRTEINKPIRRIEKKKKYIRIFIYM